MGKPPNIIMLLVDDMGYGDLTCYGGQAVSTPNIDQLAQMGARYTRFYAASAVCTPSRAAILTGRFPIRFGITKHFADDGHHLPGDTLTLATLLKNAGYATAHVGKWHLGGLRDQDIAERIEGRLDADPGPLQFGFQHALTAIEGPPRAQLVAERRLYRDGGQYLVRNDRPAPVDREHWETIKVNEAIALMEGWAGEDRPFFLNLWFDAPHTPYEPAPEPHMARATVTGATGDQLYFRSMMSHLDSEIGRLTAYLKARGMFDDTLIIFTSDNGAAWEGEVGPFKGGKTDLHEGGLRVPFFAVWPGRIPQNAVSFQRGHHVDLLPSICEAAGVPLEGLALDGVSLMRDLTGRGSVIRGVLFWQMDLYGVMQRHYPKPKPFATACVSEGPYKLLVNDRLEAIELFHLENDPREERNLLGTHGETAQALLAHVKNILAEPRSSGRRALRPEPAGR
jgi:arylsulfatase A